ncbi:MAG TPA: ATP-dependent Clp protease proteolytic subunit [Tepidisphaeraceae bacterium]|jgi:membrane-bound serine protease (ClpP class)|nr:ATP-dependent Clp protease proteolytic subunit [Tepidisphaeraceae bacterium]
MRFTIAVVAGMLLALLPCRWTRAQEAAPTRSGEPTAIVSLTGEIDDYSANDLIRRFDRARDMGAKTIIIDIDSPGGLVTSSLDISRHLKRDSDVHTIAFVRDKAYSGAAMVAMACNEIWMAPASALGDCAPIIFSPAGQLESLPAAERAKQESPIVKDFEDSARRNGYSPVLAAAMVQVERSVYYIQNDAGEKKIVDEAEYQTLTATGKWKPVPGFDNPIDGPKTLLTLYTDEAIALGLAKGRASSATELAAQQGDRLVADLRPGVGEKLVEFLNNTVVRSLLLLIFLQSLYIALSAPGHGAAEAVAVVSLGALIGVPLLTGYAQWWEVAVIFLGLGLVAFELFVFPGHFVSLIVGTLMVLFGLIMTFAGKEPSGIPGWLPSMASTWHGIQNGLAAVVSAIFAWFLLTMWLRRYLPAIPYFNKLILTATTGNTDELVTRPPKAQESWPFVGTIGNTVTDLRPGGSVEFPFGDTTRTAAVVSLNGYIPGGTKVVVEQIEGSSVRVRPI